MAPSRDPTRRAVRLQNAARRQFEAGRVAASIASYRQAVALLPANKPALQALIHFGLAEAMLAKGSVAGSRRALAVSRQKNRTLGNVEGLDACARLQARIGARGEKGLDDRECLLLLETVVRSAQRHLRAEARPARLLIHVQARARAAEIAPSTGVTRRYLFDGSRLRLAGRPRGSNLPEAHLALFPPRRGEQELIHVEGFGPHAGAARLLTIRARGPAFVVLQETVRPAPALVSSRDGGSEPHPDA